MSERLAVCAGSFDPLTNGHLDMIERSARLFDRVIVAILVNHAKQPMFTVDERVEMLHTALAPLARVEVDTFSGLLADYVRRRGAHAVIRGLRTATEFSVEWQMAMMNRHLAPGTETVFLLPSAGAAFISSRLVKEVAALGGSVEGLVPPIVADHLQRRRTTAGTIHV
jgi:pantetheine-phosphate adenylyltransferase